MTYHPQEEERAIGRITSVSGITAYEAKQKALLMIRQGRYQPGSKLDKVIKLLSTGGVFFEEQIIELTGAKKRTLQKYRKRGYIDLLPAPIKLSELIKKPRVYALGPIGLALAELQNQLVPTGYLKSSHDRITHDVLCNQLYYRIYQAAKQSGYVAILKGKYEACLHNQKGQAILEPDSMIILAREEEKHHLLIEYHNEDFSSRAREKIRKYEQIARSRYWQNQWHLDSFPPILIATTHRAPATGYNEQIKKYLEGAGIKCRYLLKSLKKLLDPTDNTLQWLDLEKNRTVNLLEI